MHRVRRTALLFLLGAAGSGALAASGSADLTSRYQAGQQQSSQLQSRIHAESNRIQGFEGTLGSLEKRLDAIQHSVDVQEQLLGRTNDQLNSARTRLSQLRARYTEDCRRWPPSCAPTTNRRHPPWWASSSIRAGSTPCSTDCRT